VGQRLLPKVLHGLDALLEQGDKDTILKMADTMALIGSGAARHLAPWGAPAPAPPTAAGTLLEESFEAIRLKVTRVHEASGEASAPARLDTGSVLDGELTVPTPRSPNHG
jgi:hypothetical protein